MSVGADPDELRRLASGGPGQAFHLDHTARLLDAAWRRYRARTTTPGADARAAADGLARLADRVSALDAWVLRVRAALLAADQDRIVHHVLALGAEHAATVSGGSADPRTLRVGRLTSAELAALAALPGLDGPWRDRLHRERARRWLTALPSRIEQVPDDLGRTPLDRVARWVDTHVVDRLSAIVDLHTSRDEEVARLRAEADGLRRLLAAPDLTVWSFSPGPDASSGATARVALGDPSTATSVAVLLPGTASGLAAPTTALQDARALYAAAGRDGAAAVVLDLYAAPRDLGRAADPRPGEAAGAATAAFVDDLPTRPARSVLVGHSYGAYTAARAAAAGAPVDALVLLGAPGTGVTRARELLAPPGEVWAARAPMDPIALVADLDELLAALPPRWRPRRGPLADPLVGLGPDPLDPSFGARRLPTEPGRDDRTAVHGHVDYLLPGSASLARVAAVVTGRGTGSREGTARRPRRSDQRQQ